MKAREGRTRQDILEAALKVFGERGYHAASVDEVARAAGITKGAMYWHFQDKRDLYLAVSMWAAGEYQKAVIAPLSSAPTLPGLVRSLFGLNARFYTDNTKISRFYATMTFEGQILSESRLVKSVADLYAEYRKSVASALSRATGRPAGSLEAIAASLIALCDGLFMQYAADPAGFPLQAGIRAATALALNGMARPAGRGGA